MSEKTLVSHRTVAQQLNMKVSMLEEAIRRGVVEYTEYYVSSKTETLEPTAEWLLTPEQAEEAGVTLRALKHRELEVPHEPRIGVTQRMYNYTFRAARLKLGLTQKLLGKRIGVSAVLIGHIETLRVFPSEKRAQQIAQVLGEPVEVLFPEGFRLFLKERELTLQDFNISLEDALTQGAVFFSQEESPEETAEFHDLQERLHEVLATLSDREQEVIRLRFGLDNGSSMLLEEVGRRFGVSRERIRQVEAKALRRLRHPSRSAKLRDFVSL